MIYVLAAIRLKEGSLEQFLDVFRANIPAVLNENMAIAPSGRCGYYD